MGSEKFSIRSGTVDFGKSYEFLIAAYYGLSLSFDRKVKDFKMSTNNTDMANFDDVVLEIIFEDGSSFLYALQLKHSASKGERNIKLDSFTAPGKGDFSLYKYCNGFRETKEICENNSSYDIPFDKFYFILFTNQELYKFETYDENHKPVDADELRLKKGDMTIYRYDKCVGGNLVNLSEADSYFIYKFKNEKGQMDENFLKQFVLYTKQKDAQEVEGLISRFISAIFQQRGSSIVTSYINFFKFWWRGDFGNVKLTKKDIMTKLAELILDPLIPNVDFETIKYYGEKSDLLKATFLYFDLTIVGSLDNTAENIIWGAILNDQVKNFEKLDWLTSSPENFFPDDINIPISAKGENFIEQNLKKIYLVLWHMDKVPLVVKISNDSLRADTYRAIKLCQNFKNKKKIILLDEVFDVDEFNGNRKLFKNLLDLKFNKDFLDAYLKNFSVSLQGRKPIQLLQLVASNSRFYDIITVKEILLMLDDNFLIDTNHIMNFPEHYVDRRVSKNFLDFRVIDEIQTDIFVIDWQVSQRTDLKRIVYNIDEYLVLKKNQNLDQTSENLILTDGDFSNEKFEEVCLLNKNKNCHHLQIVSKKRIEWVKSSGSIENLRQYRIKIEEYNSNELIRDFEILDYFSNKINILCGLPGMGKSVMFYYLKKNCWSNYWVNLINLNDHVKFFEEEHDYQQVLNYFLDYDLKDEFARKVWNLFATDKKMFFLWDGFDELPKRCANFVISTIKIMASEGYLQWISSRNNSKEYLENAFCGLSITVIPFSEEEQKRYVYNCLEEKISDEEVLKETVTKLNHCIFSSLRCGYFDYSGIPLHTYMLVEIFLKNPQKYFREIRIFTLTDIYKEFMEEKVEELFQRANANLKNVLMRKIQNKFRDIQISQYEIAALKASFDDAIFSIFNVSCDQFLQSVADNRDPLGIIIGVNNKKNPIFSHKTFEEYLTASWLAKNYQDVPNIIEVLFREDYRNIRFMFDMILSKNNPIQIAVLYRNLDILKNCEDEISTIKDDVGRNLLQIACSWGMTHPLVNIYLSEPGKTIIVSTDQISDFIFDKNIEVVKFLLSRGCDPFHRDSLANLNSIEYSAKTFSLSSLEAILSFNVNINLSELSNFDTNSFLFYCVKCNYSHLFSHLNHYPYIEIKENEDTRTLLQFAVHLNRFDMVKKLLTFGHYQRVINKPYKDVGSLLFSAASNGNLELFNLLQSYGAKMSQHQFSPLVVAVAMGFKKFCAKLLDEENIDPNHCFVDGNTLLQIAALKNHVDIMKLLLEKGCEVNNVNCFDMTALVYCIDNESVEGVKLLLNYGADVNIQSNKILGYSSLHSASEKGDLEIVKLLIRAGANTKLKSRQLYTPLHVALINKHETVAKYLIEVDSSVIDDYSEERSTPAMLAALENFHKIIELLAELKADLDSVESNDSPLRIATLKNFEESVSTLIKHGASVNKPDAHGFTPMFYAIRNEKIMRMFLDHPEIDVNFASKRLVTPLHFATENGCLRIVQELVNHGSKINAVDINNETPLHYAIRSRHDHILKYFLQHKPNLDNGFDFLRFACVNDSPGCLLVLLTVIDVNTLDNHRRNALHYAAMKSLCCAKILILKRIVVNLCDKNGYSPLTFAIFFGKIDIINELIRNGAEINIGFGSSTALHLAAGHGYEAVVIILLTLGCEVNAQDEEKRTPLHCATEESSGFFFRENLGFMKNEIRQFKNCANELIRRGALITAKNNFGWTPLLCAVYRGNLEMVKFFAEMFSTRADSSLEWHKCFIGAAGKNYYEILEFLHKKGLGDINGRDEETGMTPLGYACLGNAYKSAAYLISSGADVNGEVVDGCTPLIISSMKGYIDLVHLLVENNAEIDITNDHGNTALFTASAEGYLEIVMFLHERGGSIHVTDIDGDTPLHDAAAKGHVKIVEYLISEGADVSKKNEKQKTPVELARDNNFEDCLKIFKGSN